MSYIINPMWFYWISVVDGIKGACIALLIFSVVAVAILAIIIEMDFKSRYELHYIEMSDEDILTYERLSKMLKICIAILFVSGLGLIFIPSKDTLIEMQIAKYATYENAELSVESIKSAVDYIVNAIKGAKG